MRAEQLPVTIDEVLRALPPGHVVASADDARFVAGPAGAFVLLPTPSLPPAVAGAAERLHGLAGHTRQALCDHLSWVPFLDTLLVARSHLSRRADITVAPVDLLAVVLTEGPEVIDAESLTIIRRAVSRGLLGRWRELAGGDPGSSPAAGHRRDRSRSLPTATPDGPENGPDDRPDDRIDLCDPLPRTDQALTMPPIGPTAPGAWSRPKASS